MWRPRRVRDNRSRSNREIEAEKEWLWRWNREHPERIFASGFVPRADFSDYVLGLPNEVTNLRTYVATNHSSVYVSTTRRNWRPRSIQGTFRYDIFAPGGIDVNPTLGHHRFETQGEIAFVGGIRTEYIFGATEYGSNSRQIRYHRNPFYRGIPNPRARLFQRVCQLATRTYTLLSRSPQSFCPDPRRSSKRKKRSISTELMRVSGDLSDPMNSCSYWYKVEVKFLKFAQSGELGQIEPYGKVEVYSKGRLTLDHVYHKSVVWNTPRGKNERVDQNKEIKLPNACWVIQADRNSDKVPVCFDGNVQESDSLSSDDNIATFKKKCRNTEPNRYPSRSYFIQASGFDGNFEVAFSVTPCDKQCIKDNFNAYDINGKC